MTIYQVDAFTDRVFSGNPAGVCILESWKDERWMQNMAREINLSETAFLVKMKDCFGLRWFTPAKEVDLCGHATLASAHILWETGILDKSDTARFDTRSGILTAGWLDGLITLNFPKKEEKKADIPDDLTAGLGVPILYCGDNKMDYLVLLESEEIVRSLKPDLSILKRINNRGVLVTAQAKGKEYDFVSRLFAPAFGIDEDPVTGSTHCCLGPFWQKRLGKSDLSAYQASERGGHLWIKVKEESVDITGKAVTVFKAEIKDEVCQ
jgi:PhzF family phenazine biosynthesis protein